jgi:hypothetical protein
MSSTLLSFDDHESFRNEFQMRSDNCKLFERKLSFNEAKTAFSLPATMRHPPLARSHSEVIGNKLSLMKAQASMLPSIADTTEKLLTQEMMVGEQRFRARAFSECSQLDLSSDLQQQQPQATSRYKTELCRPFEENGKCKYGDKCQFAHGKHEVRHLVRHPKYKTELCRTYHTSGFCPYGPRCHFIHNQDDLIMPNSGDAMVMSNEKQQRQPMYSDAIQIPSAPVPIERNMMRPGHLKLVSSSNKFSPHLHTTSPMSMSMTPPGFDSLISPISPLHTTHNMFGFANPSKPMQQQHHHHQLQQHQSASDFFPGHRQTTPPLDTFNVFVQSSKMLDQSIGDDVFEESLTPSDSDRESDTGSPRGSTHPVAAATGQSQQRLPIFRCLSKSEA